MDRDGLLLSIFDSVERIDRGIKWLDTAGLESKGRSSYRGGLERALNSFQSAKLQVDQDLQLLILAEKVFITQELQFCDSSETHTISSLEQAIRSFDDALGSLEIVKDHIYYSKAEKTYPTHKDYRYKGMPKDAFCIACIGHRTRLSNILRAPRINLAEKQLLLQRSENMKTAQNAYYVKQKIALGV